MSLPIPSGAKLPQVIKELNALGVQVDSIDTIITGIAAEVTESQSHWADIHDRITALEEKVRSLIPCPGAESESGILVSNPEELFFAGVEGVLVDSETQTLSFSSVPPTALVGALSIAATEDWLIVTQLTETTFSVKTKPTAGQVAGNYADVLTVSGVGVQILTIPVVLILEVENPLPILTVVEPSFSFAAVEGGAAPATQTIHIQNIGTGDLTQPVITQVGGDESWLSFGTVTGAADDWQAVITVDDTLAEGSYVKTIRVTDPAAPGQTVDRVITVTVAAAPTVDTLVMSVAPSPLQFNAVEGGSPSSSQFITITGVGTLPFAGVMVSEVGGDASWLSTIITMITPQQYKCEVIIDSDAELAGDLTKTLRFTDANQTNAAQDAVVNVHIDAIIPGLYTSFPVVLASNSGIGSGLVVGALPVGPVAPYVITEQDVLDRKIALWIAGVEVPIWCEAQHGRWFTGSGGSSKLRGLSIRTIYNIPSVGIPIVGEVRVGVVRATTDLLTAAVAVTQAEWDKERILVSSDVAQLCESFAGLQPLLPYSEENAANQANTDWIIDRFNKIKLKERNAEISAGATYEHVRVMFQLYMKTGDLTYYFEARHRAHYGLRAVMADPSNPNVIPNTNEQGWAGGNLTTDGQQPEWQALRYIGMNAAYRFTGCINFYNGVCPPINAQFANNTTFLSGAGTAASPYTGAGGDGTWAVVHPTYIGRFNVRYLFNAILGVASDATKRFRSTGGYGSPAQVPSNQWPIRLPWILDAFERHIYTLPDYRAGMVGNRQTSTNGGTLPASNVPLFQMAITAHLLRMYHYNVFPDPRCLTWIQKLCDIQIASSFLLQAGDSGFGVATYGYHYMLDSTSGRGAGVAEPWSLPMWAASHAFVYAKTGNALYKTWHDRCIDPANSADSHLGFTWTVQTPLKLFGELFGDQMDASYHIQEGEALQFLNSAIRQPTLVP